MLIQKSVSAFLDELASRSPAPGGGSVAALAGAAGSALSSMVCNLTIGKTKYAAVEPEMKALLAKTEEHRRQFTTLVDRDTEVFTRVMEAYSLPKDNDDQKALRRAAIQEATKEAVFVPLAVMRHTVDALALAATIAQKGNKNSVSDAGVSALMLQAACESAALNVQINLQGIEDMEFVGWHTEEMNSILRSSRSAAGEILSTVVRSISGS